MATTSDYLTQLQTDKANLVTNLNEKGVLADNSETFTSLVPKVLEIEGGSSSSVSQLNIFVQDTEPDTKNGIWIKDSALSNKNVSFLTSGISSLVWEENIVPVMPYSCREMGIAKINKDIYLVAGNKYTGSLSVTNDIYKYDTVAKNYTLVTQLPYSAYGVGVVSDNEDDLYIFGGRNGNTTYNYAYKYTVSTNTFTSLTNIPYTVGQMGIVKLENYIYLVGGTIGSSQTPLVYRYDITNNSYEQLTSLPGKLNTPGVVTYDNKIYIFGGYNGSSVATSYEYDPKTNSYLELDNMLYAAYGLGAIVIDNNCHIFGGVQNGATNEACFYDFLSKSFKKDPSLIVGRGRLSAIEVDGIIYLFGGLSAGGSTNTAVQSVLMGDFSYKIPKFENDAIIIWLDTSSIPQITLGKTNSNYLKIKPMLVELYESENSKIKLNAYYGNGTNWTEI